MIRHDEKVATLPLLTIAWHSPGYLTEGDATADVLATVLATGKASRLYKRLVLDKQLAQSVDASQQSIGAQSVFSIEVVARPGVSTDTLKKEVDAVLEEVRKNGVTPDEVNRARTRFDTQFLAGLQSIGGFGGKADVLQNYNHFIGEPSWVAQDLARYEAVTPEQVKRFATEQLRQHRARGAARRARSADSLRSEGEQVMRRLFLSLCTLALAAACASTPEPAPQSEPTVSQPTPPAPPAKAEDAEAFRAKMPTPAKPPDLVLPTFEEAKLDNGLTVLVSSRRQLPLVYVGMAFASGSAQDPKGQAGTADIAYKMLLEGAGGKDTVALDNAFADLGVSPGVTVNPDGAFVGVRVLTRNVEPALGAAVGRGAQAHLRGEGLRPAQEAAAGGPGAAHGHPVLPGAAGLPHRGVRRGPPVLRTPRAASPPRWTRSAWRT